MALKFIDIGINLTDPMFRGIYRGTRAHADDLVQVLQRARRAGVDRMIVTAGNIGDCREALALTKDDPALFFTVGCHPTRCSEFDKYKGGPKEYFHALKTMLENPETKPKVVAIGECGLDYDRLFFCPKDTQIKYFEWQFELAELTGLPMFFHDRNTGGDFAAMIAKNRNRFKDGVVHSFTGTMEDLKFYLDQGLYISINGCSLKTEDNLKVAASVPVDRLMLETDGPWCDIRPTHASFAHLRGMTDEQKAIFKPAVKAKERFESGLMVKGRNEPCTIGQVLLVLADLHGMGAEELADVCYKNTLRVFFPNEAI
ncbi:TatD DNase [Dissophora globulifera]|uniref:TatD DNase n=1 Tax=Dissophora globulifera TaxID=979702 RepID=A0A9P6RUD0_9FUNG|nr:TatD DNase [Dissophora globulifera]